MTRYVAQEWSGRMTNADTAKCTCTSSYFNHNLHTPTHPHTETQHLYTRVCTHLHTHPNSPLLLLQLLVVTLPQPANLPLPIVHLPYGFQQGRLTGSQLGLSTAQLLQGRSLACLESGYLLGQLCWWRQRQR